MKSLLLGCFMGGISLSAIAARAAQPAPAMPQAPVTQETAKEELPQLLTLHAKLADGAIKAQQAQDDIITQEKQLARFGRELQVARTKLRTAEQQMAGASYIPSSIRKPLQSAIEKQKQLLVVLQRLIENGNAMVVHLKAHLPTLSAKAQELAGNVKELYTQGSAVLGTTGAEK